MTTCRDVRRTMEDGGGMAAAELDAHVARCAGCRAHRALLMLFADIAPGEADDATVARIAAALPKAPWRRHSLWSWLPLAAGVAAAAFGLVLLGGVPAGGAVGGFLRWLASWTLDSLAAARGSSDAMRTLLTAGSGWLLAWLAIVALGGSWAVTVLLRRGGRG